MNVDTKLTLFLLTAGFSLYTLHICYRMYISWLTEKAPVFFLGRHSPSEPWDTPADIAVSYIVCPLVAIIVFGGILSWIVQEVGIFTLLHWAKPVAYIAIGAWFFVKAAKLHKRLYKMRNALKEKCEFFKVLINMEEK